MEHDVQKYRYLTLFLAAVGEQDFSFLKAVLYKKV
jgi:hypothetical protein